MESLEDLVMKMESQMDRADSKLDILSSRLDLFESRVIPPYSNEGNPSEQENGNIMDGNMQVGENTAKERAGNEEDHDSLDPKLLTELLIEVTRVKEEYDQLLSDVHQVQELQQEVTRSLRKQMKQVQTHFDRLRERVIGSTGGGNSASNK